MDTTAVEQTAPDFGIFNQLGDYGPIGLAALALGYVAWLFIKRYLDENKKMKEELAEKKVVQRKNRK
jgi:hypothetical protein